MAGKVILQAQQAADSRNSWVELRTGTSLFEIAARIPSSSPLCHVLIRKTLWNKPATQQDVDSAILYCIILKTTQKRCA